eukprot:GHVQ01041015.1.p1 GENE.GHVQ01041015.1~~GHVQ01041015.1.p1  ORF type:complete len:215 (-),score=3.78 GHVQ01041015.1:1253-1897(-)
MCADVAATYTVAEVLSRQLQLFMATDSVEDLLPQRHVTDRAHYSPSQVISIRHGDILRQIQIQRSTKQSILGFVGICAVVAIWVSSGYLFKILQSGNPDGPTYDKPCFIVFLSQSACMVLLLVREKPSSIYLRRRDKTNSIACQSSQCRFWWTSHCRRLAGCLPDDWMPFTVLGVLIVLFRCLWSVSLRWTAVSLNIVLYDSYVLNRLQDFVAG